MTSADALMLFPAIRRLASWHSRNFPVYLLDVDDLIQEGFIGVLKVAQEPITDSHRGLYLVAARRQMIHAIRSIHDTRKAGRRKREFLVADLAQLVDLYGFADYQRRGMSEQEVISILRDFHNLASLLPHREQAILRARLYGETHKSIAQQLNYTEGRIWQIEQQIIMAMREAV